MLNAFAGEHGVNIRALKVCVVPASWPPPTLWLALDPRCCLLCVCGCRTFAAGCSCC